MTEELSAVRLELNGRAESSSFVRAALSGLAEVRELDPELFDDVKTAVTEACNNVILYAYDGQPGRYVVAFEAHAGGIEATIRDWGSGIRHAAPSEERMGVGLAVISALADRAEFISIPEGGTEVRMAWGEPDDDGPYAAAVGSGSGDGLPARLAGDVVVTVSPPTLLPGVLRRVARAVAARTQLSLDRFEDIDRVSAALGAAVASSGDGEIRFAASGGGHWLELTVGAGPLGPDVGAGPFAPGDGPPFERVSGSELVRVVIDE